MRRTPPGDRLRGRRRGERVGADTEIASGPVAVGDEVLAFRISGGWATEVTVAAGDVFASRHRCRSARRPTCCSSRHRLRDAARDRGRRGRHHPGARRVRGGRGDRRPQAAALGSRYRDGERKQLRRRRPGSAGCRSPTATGSSSGCARQRPTAWRPRWTAWAPTRRSTSRSRWWPTATGSSPSRPRGGRRPTASPRSAARCRPAWPTAAPCARTWCGWPARDASSYRSRGPSRSRTPWRPQSC